MGSSFSPTAPPFQPAAAYTPSSHPKASTAPSSSSSSTNTAHGGWILESTAPHFGTFDSSSSFYDGGGENTSGTGIVESVKMGDVASQRPVAFERRSFRDVSSEGDIVVLSRSGSIANSGGRSTPTGASNGNGVGAIGDGRKFSRTQTPETFAAAGEGEGGEVGLAASIEMGRQDSTESERSQDSSGLQRYDPTPTDFDAGGRRSSSKPTTAEETSNEGATPPSFTTNLSNSSLFQSSTPPTRAESRSSAVPVADPSSSNLNTFDTLSLRLSALESTVTSLRTNLSSQFRTLSEEVGHLRGLVLQSSPASAVSPPPPPPSHQHQHRGDLNSSVDSPHFGFNSSSTLSNLNPNVSAFPFPASTPMTAPGLRASAALSYLSLPLPPATSNNSLPTPSHSPTSLINYFDERTSRNNNHNRPSPSLGAGGGFEQSKDDQIRSLTAQLNALSSSVAHLVGSNSGVSAAGIHIGSQNSTNNNTNGTSTPSNNYSLIQQSHPSGTNSNPISTNMTNVSGTFNASSNGIGSVMDGWKKDIVAGSGNGVNGTGNGSSGSGIPSPHMRPSSANSNRALPGGGGGGALFGIGGGANGAAPGAGGNGVGAAAASLNEERRRSSQIGFGPIGAGVTGGSGGGAGTGGGGNGGGGGGSFDGSSFNWDGSSTNSAGGGGGMPSPLVGLVASSITGNTQGSLGGKWEQLGVGADLFRTIAKFGLGSPTRLQTKAIPCILRQQDVVAQVPSIQERIQAYIVPSVQMICNLVSQANAEGISHIQKGIQIVVATATVDQAAQAQRLALALGGSLGIRTSLCINHQGDLASEASNFLRTPPHILIGTPQRLLELFSMRLLPIEDIRLFVVDEADQQIARHLATFVVSLAGLLPPTRIGSGSFPSPESNPGRSPLIQQGGSGFFDSNSSSMSSSALSPSPPAAGGRNPERQTAIFSCTIPQDVVNLATALQLREPVRVLVRREGGDNPSPSVRGLKQYHLYIAVSNQTKPIGLGMGMGRRDSNPVREWKLESLADLCEDYPFDHCVIFCSSVDAVEAVSYKLSLRSIEALSLHQDVGVAARHQIMSKFRSTIPNRTGTNKRCLVVYDALCRTLTDVHQVPLVINFDLPRDVESYAHRVACATSSGAAGFGRTGIVINFVTPGTEVQMLQNIETYYRCKIPEFSFVPNS